MSSKKLTQAKTPTRRFTLAIEGVGTFNEWTSAEVVRDLEDFSGSFSFTLRDDTRSIATFDYASPGKLYKLRPGPGATVFVDGEKVLVGWIEKVEPDINADFAEVTISGRDKSGDMVESTAAADGPGEFKKVKLEKAIEKIAKPFKLKVRNEIKTGKAFPRYAIDLAETGLSAIEKGARQRHALVMSDGIGGIVITRTGADKAPGDITLPGNVLSAGGAFSTENRHSETIVRGQAERAGEERKGRKAALSIDGIAQTLEARAEPKKKAGSATERERKGITITGRAIDKAIKRYRPKVHLAKTQPGKEGAQDEADFRKRTARSEGEGFVYTVHGYRGGLNETGGLWKVNQKPHVSDAFLGTNRRMLISRTTYRYDDNGEITELGVKSPETFDKKPTSNRRTNAKSGKSKSTKSKSSKAGKTPLDGTAKAL